MAERRRQECLASAFLLVGDSLPGWLFITEGSPAKEAVMTPLRQRMLEDLRLRKLLATDSADLP